MSESAQFQILKEQLARNVDACNPPELSDADLNAILQANAQALIWQPSTLYLPGQIVVPDELSAFSYRALTGGTSGATAPDWAVNLTGGYGWGGNPAFCCAGWGAVVTDGTITWVQWEVINGLYDLAQATADGWLLKCAKAVTLIATSSAGQSTASQLVFDHCERMAAHWQPYRVG